MSDGAIEGRMIVAVRPGIACIERQKEKAERKHASTVKMLRAMAFVKACDMAWTS